MSTEEPQNDPIRALGEYAAAWYEGKARQAHVIAQAVHAIYGLHARVKQVEETLAASPRGKRRDRDRGVTLTDESAPDDKTVMAKTAEVARIIEVSQALDQANVARAEAERELGVARATILTLKDQLRLLEEELAARVAEDEFFRGGAAEAVASGLPALPEDVTAARSGDPVEPAPISSEVPG